MNRELAEARVGQTIEGKYQLQRLIGMGGMASVYEAHHRYTQRSVAVKILHEHMHDIPEAVQRFLREARATAELGHPAIVAVLDAGETGDRHLYMVQELVEGQTLEQRMEAGELPVGDLMHIAVQILDGLVVAHERGVVHRDIKPDNVVLVKSGSPRGFQAKLVDFGVAKLMQSTIAITAPGRTVGTALYMSPEQVRADKVDRRTDLWSMGAVLFHASTGRPPYEGNNLAELLVKLATARARSIRELRQDLPDNLCVAVDRALEPDVARRWQTAEEMAAVLRSADASVAGLDWDD